MQVICEKAEECLAGAMCGHITPHDKGSGCSNFHCYNGMHSCVPICPDKVEPVADCDHMRKFDSGATRDTAEGKFDYEGFLSPWVLERFAQYMHKHRKQADGVLRDSDNWQKGIPRDVYIKSMFRHFMDLWFGHRGEFSQEGTEESLCALMFNVQGYLHELLKGVDND